MTAGQDTATPKWPRRLLNAVWAATALGAATAYFYQFFSLSSDRAWTMGLGDWIDPYYVSVVLESWYRSALGLAGNPTPPMYFPDIAARYSHGFALYAPVYAVARLFTHPFTATTLTLVIVMIGGSWCLYLLLRRFGLAAVEALALSVFFYTSPNIANSSTVVWAQRASVFLIPPILLVLFVAIGTPPERRRRRAVLGGLAGLLAGLFLAQDFYTSALLGLMLALVGASFLLLRPRNVLVRLSAAAIASLVEAVPPARRPSRWWLVPVGVLAVVAIVLTIHPLDRFYIAGWGISARDPAPARRVAWLALLLYAVLWGVRILAVLMRGVPETVARSVRNVIDGCPPVHRPLIAAIAGGGLLGTLVFLAMYLKPYIEFPTFERVMIMDVLHPASLTLSGNIVATIRSANSFESLRPFEIALGLVLIMWVFPRTVDRRTRVHGLWFVLVSAIVFVMPLRFGDFSPWMTFFSWLPFMSAVRDPRRMIYLYELALVLLAGMWLVRFPPRSSARIVAVLLVAGITYYEWHTAEAPYQRENRVFDQWVRSPIAIDPSCRSFFVKGASADYMSRSGHMWSLYAVDAAFIALEHGMPTLNGYSAWAPKGWEFANPQIPEAPGQVDDWIRMHNLHGVCELDIEARTMKPHVVRP